MIEMNCTQDMTLNQLIINTSAIFQKINFSPNSPTLPEVILTFLPKNLVYKWTIFFWLNLGHWNRVEFIYKKTTENIISLYAKVLKIPQDFFF